MKTFSNKPMILFAALVLMSMDAVACWASRPASYTSQLADCTEKSKTCEESIACENEVRVKYKRPLRDADGGCK
jgi:hypothetical protein